MFDLNSLIRPHILTLQPYQSAREEYQGSEGTFLDANENAFGTPGVAEQYDQFHRYPDPYQRQLKQRLSEVKQVPAENIFLGNGSDEIVDLIIKAFCCPGQSSPGHDNVVILPPTFGMYRVAAAINDVPVHLATLTEDYAIDEAALQEAVDDHTKIIFFCSPNNPTGNLLDRTIIERWVKNFSGLVVVDEAYVDFAGAPSFATQLADYPNLIVMQTLSKAWGMAALRLGMAFASSEIVAVLNKIKMPYNVNRLTQERAIELLQHESAMHDSVREIIALREQLTDGLRALPLVQRIYPSDANFLLVKVQQADAVFAYLLEQQVIVRNQSHVRRCEGGFRITVGTAQENRLLINALANVPQTATA